RRAADRRAFRRLCRRAGGCAGCGREQLGHARDRRAGWKCQLDARGRRGRTRGDRRRMSDGAVDWTAVPAPTAHRLAPRRPGVHMVLFLATAVTTTMAGANWAGVDALESPRAMLEGLPFAIALLAILLSHEFGHYFMCVRHGVDATLPYLIPGPPLLPLPGTFGALIRIRSRWGDRRALFDVGAGGPWAGFVVAV